MSQPGISLVTRLARYIPLCMRTCLYSSKLLAKVRSTYATLAVPSLALLPMPKAHELPYVTLVVFWLYYCHAGCRSRRNIFIPKVVTHVHDVRAFIRLYIKYLYTCLRAHSNIHGSSPVQSSPANKDTLSLLIHLTYYNICTCVCM